MRSLAATLLALSLGLTSLAGEVTFTTRPSATRAGGRVKITFALNAETDVAVYVQDAAGKVIRHLVAGRLGKNPPKPLKPGLSQSIQWDGKANYGKAATGGPFKVRVAAGLGAKYDKIIAANRTYVGRVYALGCGPKGTLYVVNAAGGAVWQGPQMLAFNRDGSYKRMLMPFPSNMKKAQVKGISTVELDGRPAPLLQSHAYGMYPGFKLPWPSQLAVTPDGKRIYLPFNGYRWPPPPSIGILDSEGGCPVDKLSVQIGAKGKRPVMQSYTGIAISSDGTYAFVSGLRPHVYKKREHCAVYRVPLPARNPCTPFFGDPAKAGKGEKLLGGAPRGLVSDGKGKLYVTDYRNNRIVILSEKDGKFLGEFAANRPDYIGLDVKKGVAYISSYGKGGVTLTKFKLSADRKSAQVGYKMLVRLSRPQYSMAVDASAQPAVLWLGGKFGELRRIEDKGGKFGDIEPLSPGMEGLKSLPECYLAVEVDRARGEIYTRNSPGGGLWYRYSEKTGKIEKVRIPGSAGGGGKGFQIVPHPDGNLYGLRWPFNFLKYDRNGRPAPWAAPIDPTEHEAKTHGVAHKPIPAKQLKALTKKPRSTSFLPVSMVELPHTLGIRRSDGHLFVFAPRVRNRTCKTLHEYLPSGKRISKQPIIWKTTDAVIGPKFDAAGNIYVAEAIHPKGWLYPPELAAAFKKQGIKGLAGPARVAVNMYGSIVKFSPQGGAFDIQHGRYFPNPYDGEAKLPAGLKTTEIEFFSGGQIRPAKVTGAEWVHPGMGHVGLFRCNCENANFDVDEFGRVFFPDFHLYRIRVIDTNGNAITHFGGYGNAESRGKDSPVVDAETGQLRPPKEGEVSPFAKPDIALAWPVGLGVNDKYAYIGDSLNRRLMRVKFTYQVEETVGVK
jgi:DNA-binding beta-propeller fold protein YncE